MGKYISIGKFNKYYFFILGSITLKFLISFSIGFYPTLTPNKPLYLFVFKSVLLEHPIIKNILEYFGIGLGGIILDFIFHKKNKYGENTSNLTNSNLKKRASTLLIYNNIFLKNKKIYLKKVIFIFFSYYYANILISSFDSLGFHQLKVWTLEILAFLYFYKKILGKKIYRHQELSLIITLIFATLLFVINSFIPNTNEDCSLLANEDEKDNCILLSINVYKNVSNILGWYFIPVIMIIYLSAMTCDAYACVRNKWFMDIKYITIFKILTYIGIIGFVFSLILLFIISYIPCSSDSIINSICQLKYNDLLYYDNFKILMDINVDKKFFFEIFFILPLFIIFNFLRTYFNLLIINYLDPFYLIPIDTVYFIIYQTLDFFLSLSKKNIFYIIRFIIATLSDLTGIICFLVYLEIIELHFYDLDKNIKKNIIIRGERESFSELMINSNNDNTNEDNIIIDDNNFDESFGN